MNQYKNIFCLLGFAISTVVSFSVSANEKLIGTWETQCLLTSQNQAPLAHPLRGQSYQARVTFFNNEALDFTKLVFSDNECKVLSNSVTWGSTYRATPEGHIDFLLDSVTITARNSSTVSDFNQNQFCFSKEWRMNAPLQVAGVVCDKNIFGMVGYTAYNVFEVIVGDESYQLRLDFDRPGFSADGRPSSIVRDATTEFKKVFSL